MITHVRLLWVEGEDAEDFKDLIGYHGELVRDRPSRATFMPSLDRTGHWVVVTVSAESVDACGRLRLTSRRGLTYVFRILTPPKDKP